MSVTVERDWPLAGRNWDWLSREGEWDSESDSDSESGEIQNQEIAIGLDFIWISRWDRLEIS